MTLHEKNRVLEAKYAITGWFYDVLDYPWEIQYRRWRPSLHEGVRGRVLEAGVGTGRNLAFYDPGVELLGIDLSDTMLRKAAARARRAPCAVELRREDATVLSTVPSDHFDWVLSTFMCCVMPDELQPEALAQLARVLKPGGRLRLVEIVFSKDPALRRRQQRLAGFAEKVYGARFDRQSLRFVEEAPSLELLGTRYLKADTHLLIDARRRP